MSSVTPTTPGQAPDRRLPVHLAGVDRHRFSHFDDDELRHLRAFLDRLEDESVAE